MDPDSPARNTRSKARAAAQAVQPISINPPDGLPQAPSTTGSSAPPVKPTLPEFQHTASTVSRRSLLSREDSRSVPQAAVTAARRSTQRTRDGAAWKLRAAVRRSQADCEFADRPVVPLEGVIAELGRNVGGGYHEEHSGRRCCEGAPTKQAAVKKRKATVAVVEDLPTPPEYLDVLQHALPHHNAEVRLPENTAHTPYGIFTAFYAETILSKIARSTKLYAAEKRARVFWGQRPWRPVSVAEIRLFLGLQIHMGLYHVSRLDEYWSKGEEAPSYPLMRKMGRQHFEQIQRYLHIATPRVLTPSECWKKVEPLSSYLKKRFQKYYFPSSILSIDEMMVAFQGRSGNTVCMPNKPISEGLKVYALADHSFTFAWHFYSPLHGLETETLQRIQDLHKHLCVDGVYLGNVCKTAEAVIALAFSLPYHEHTFDLYMDNYFTSLGLFRFLKSLGIGAAGTRVSGASYPGALKIDKTQAKKKLEWNHLSGVVVDGVAALLWQDNNCVSFLSTIHNLQSFVKTSRKKPKKKTSSNASNVRAVFDVNEHVKTLEIPQFINDYNHHMGGVDVAVQYRSYYKRQRKARRKWLPLHYFLLDTTIVNCFIMARRLSMVVEESESQQSTEQRRQTAVLKTHRALRKSLAKELVNTTHPELHPRIYSKPKSTSYVTNATSLPSYHSRTSGTHTQISYGLKTRKICWYCRYKRRMAGSTIKVIQTTLGCDRCNIALRRSCFQEYHHTPPVEEI